MAEGFSIAEGFVEIFSRIDRARNRRNAQDAGDEAGESFVTKMGKKLVTGIGSSVLPALGAVLNAGLAAAPALAAAGVAIYQVSAAAVAAAPAILAIGVSFKLVALTITALAPAIAKSMSPISDAFTKATESAGKLATNGLRPLSQEFVRVNFPAVRMMIDNIAKATNGVIGDTLRWVNTARGQQAITNITSATGAAMLRLAKPLSSVVTSFIAMVGRIAGVSLAAGESGLTGILHKVEIMLDRITAESVQGGLDKLKSTFIAVRDAVQTVAHWIEVAIGIYRQYRTEIMLISDALGILAIVFGGPVTAIIALIGLVVRHFDMFKAAYDNLRNSFMQSTEGPAFLNNLKAAADIVVPALVAAFRTIWAAIGPTLQKIWTQIKTQLIPAFGEFIAAAAPLVKFFVERLAPMVANAMNTVLKVISGVITIITGIFKVFTGILRGDWSQVWEGIKQILRGAVTILVSIVKGLVTLIKQGLSNLGAILSGIFSRAVAAAVNAFRQLPGKAKQVVGQVKSAIVSAFSSSGTWLLNAGSKIIGGLIEGIGNRVRDLKTTLGNVTGLIPKWKGPPKKDAVLLTPAGRSIMDGLIRGIIAKKPNLKAELARITEMARIASLKKRQADLFKFKRVQGVGTRPSGDLPNIGTGSGTAGGTTAQTGGLTIGQLVIQLQGILDPTDPASTRRMIAALFELLKAYERQYA